MFGDYIDRGSAGAVFSSPTDRNQVIKIFNLDARDDMVSHMNRLQFQFFEDLEAQQKQDIKTPGLPQINYTFTGKMTPEIMTQISESLKPSQQVDYSAIKSNFRYGDKYAIILMDRVSQIGPQEYEEPLGRRGLTPMLRHAYKMGYYVRDLWPENKGMSSAGDIIWFDPMVAPVNPVSDQDREALKILFEWDEDRQKQYQEAVRDKSYFDYEHKAGLFYAEDNTAITSVSYQDIDNPEWLSAVPRQMLLPQNTELGVLDDYGNTFNEIMLGPDYQDAIKKMVINNPNGFMMTWKGSDFIEPPLGEIDLDHTFWVYPLNKITDPKYEKWDAVVIDGNWVMSGGEKGTYDSYPLNDLFDATTGENPVYELRRFTKIMLGPLPKHSAINYTHILDKPYRSMYAFNSEDDNYWLRGGCGKAAAMISKDLDQKNIPYHYEIGLAYIEDVFFGNHIVVVSEAGDQDHYGTQGAKKRWENMLLSELVDQELPASMVEDIITFQWHKVNPQEDWSVEIAGEYLPVSGPMITKDTLSMSAEDCSQCDRTNIDTDDTEYDEYCGGCGAYLCDECYEGGDNNIRWEMDWPHEWEPPYLSKHETQQHYNNELIVAACCLQKAITYGFVPAYSTVESLSDIMKPYQYVSMNYVLGGLKKMSAEDENRYHDCATCNRKNVDNEESDEDGACHMIGCGNYFCYQCMDDGGAIIFGLDDRRGGLVGRKIQETYFGGSSPSVGKCCLQKATDLGFKMYSGYGGIERLVEEGYLPNQSYVSMNYVLGGLDKMSAESYPTCYLCSKPAKIEVMTAIGMRSFCGNKCRGDYEGIDYGPDDYYISPKLEHDIELVSYDPGRPGSRYSKKSATLSAKCRNCDFTTRDQSFYEHHLVKSLREWDEDIEEWWDTGQKCRHEKMQYLDYLENGEDAWGNVIAGHIVIGCPTCGFKDTLTNVDIPQGCDNRGRIEDYVRF